MLSNELGIKEYSKFRIDEIPAYVTGIISLIDELDNKDSEFSEEYIRKRVLTEVGLVYKMLKATRLLISDVNRNKDDYLAFEDDLEITFDDLDLDFGSSSDIDGPNNQISFIPMSNEKGHLIRFSLTTAKGTFYFFNRTPFQRASPSTWSSILEESRESLLGLEHIINKAFAELRYLHRDIELSEIRGIFQSILRITKS